MKTYYLEDDENFKEVIQWLDTIEDEWQIYIDSYGWKTSFYTPLLSRIEEVNKNKKITLRLITWFSNAFSLFYNYTWNKIIEGCAEWMVHKCTYKCDIFSQNNKLLVRTDESVKRSQIENLKTENPPIFLTEEEKVKFNEWYDIYLSYDRLKQIFNK